MINYEFRDHAKVTSMCSVQERTEIIERAETRINIKIIGDVVAVVAQRGRIKWQQPDCGDPQLLKVIQLFDQAAEITHPVAVAIAESLNVQLVDDRVLVPKRIDNSVICPLGHAVNS